MNAQIDDDHGAGSRWEGLGAASPKPANAPGTTAQDGLFGVDARRSGTRRPLTDEEFPHLEALGAELRELRERASLSRSQLGWAATVSVTHLANLEGGHRRTRRSTLLRIAGVLVDHIPGYLGSPDDLADYLCAVAGPALAAESQYAARVDRRRGRRVTRAERLAALALPIAQAMAREMARDIVEARRRPRYVGQRGRPRGS